MSTIDLKWLTSSLRQAKSRAVKPESLLGLNSWLESPFVFNGLETDPEWDVPESKSSRNRPQMPGLRLGGDSRRVHKYKTYKNVTQGYIFVRAQFSTWIFTHGQLFYRMGQTIKLTSKKWPFEFTVSLIEISIISICMILHDMLHWQ